uniref:Uncharacterized protein n=1 Tax=Arundo donax TaxID=35708 RepID=A0A0A8Y6E8_ARUDO
MLAMDTTAAAAPLSTTRRSLSLSLSSKLFSLSLSPVVWCGVVLASASASGGKCESCQLFCSVCCFPNQLLLLRNFASRLPHLHIHHSSIFPTTPKSIFYHRVRCCWYAGAR